MKLEYLKNLGKAVTFGPTQHRIIKDFPLEINDYIQKSSHDPDVLAKVVGNLNEQRSGYLAIPEDILAVTADVKRAAKLQGPTYKDSPRTAWYDPNTHEVAYNPFAYTPLAREPNLRLKLSANVPAALFQMVPHEETHVIQDFADRFLGTYIKDAVHHLKRVEKISSRLEALAGRGYLERLIGESSADFLAKPHSISPRELQATDMQDIATDYVYGSGFRGGPALPTPDGIMEFRNIFYKAVKNTAEEAHENFFVKYPFLRKYFSVVPPAAAGIAALSQAENSNASGALLRTEPEQRTEQPSKTSKFNLSANVPLESGEGLFSEGMEKVGSVFWNSLMKNGVKLVDPLTPDETVGVGLAAMAGGMLSTAGAVKNIVEGSGTAEDVMDVVSTATGVRPGVALAKGARSAWEVLGGKKIPKLFGEDPLSK